MIAWWHLEAAANLTIALAYLVIGILIIVPIIRMRQLSNKLAVATAAIFVSCAFGHFAHFLQPGMPAGSHLMTMGTWWSAVIHAATACVAVYYLTLRRYYGRLLQAPMFDDLKEQQRVRELESFQALAAGRAEAEDERDFAVALMSSINEHSQSLIYVKDLQGRYLMVNAAVEKTFQRPAADLVGKTFDKINTTDSTWESQDMMGRNGPEHELAEIDLPDGRHFFETVKFPLFKPKGVLYAVCGMPWTSPDNDTRTLPWPKPATMRSPPTPLCPRRGMTRSPPPPRSRHSWRP